MAPSARHFSFLFFLALLSSLHAINARESHFFSKVTSTPNNDNAKETVEVPNKEQPLTNQEQEPTFIPDTQNAYGLYGHESSQLPTTKTATAAPYATTNLPYKAESGELYTNTNNNNNDYYNKDAYETDPQGMSDTRFTNRGYTTTAGNNNNYNNKHTYVTDPQGSSDTRFMDKGYTTPTSSNNNYYNKDAYVIDPQGLSDTRFMDRGYTTTIGNNYKDAYVTDPQMSDARFMDRGYTTTTGNNYKDAYVTDPQGKGDTWFMDRGYNSMTRNYYNGANKYNAQQGMSDTRFLENGRYFYDIKSENNYLNGYENSKGVDYNNKPYYGNNENSYEHNHPMGGYQNQEEFQQSQEEYVP